MGDSLIAIDRPKYCASVKRMRSTTTVAEEEREAPSNSEMTSSLPAMSGCSKAVLELEMLIWR